MKSILVVAAALAFVLSPLVSQSFGGFDPGQFPVPQDNPPAQPAGWAFSIWTLIYGWLLVHACFGLLRRADAADWGRTRWPLIASLVLGAAWIPVALRSPQMATAIIWAMLATAHWALLAAPDRDRWWARVPLALYAGWLTAASWVSIALIGAGWGIGPGATGWAWIALAGALATALAVLVRLGRAPEYAVPLSWALIGIAAANWSSATLLASASALGAAALLIVALALPAKAR